MATKKKLLQAAAGTAAASGGAGALNVEDVFSTYLYEGNGSSQVIENGINLGQSFGSGSADFDGNDYITSSSGYLTSIGTGDFTIEGWWYFKDFTARTYFTRCWSFGTGISNDVTLSVNTSGQLQYRNNDSVQFTASSSISANGWNHIALCRNSGTTTLYLNGISVGSASNNVDFSTVANNSFYVGVESDGNGGYMNGYASNIRIVNGTAVYTSNFTSPTSELTAISGTSLLTLQGDSPFVDNSSSALTITQNGDPKASTFGPFDAAEAGDGGMVWTKDRVNGGSSIYHHIMDTEATGLNKTLWPNDTSALYSGYGASSWNANGYTVNSSGSSGLNNTSGDYVSWTWKKQPKFFDIQTFTVPSSGTDQTISHNLNTTVGLVITKLTSTSSSWYAFHTSRPNKYLTLNSNSAEGAWTWSSTNTEIDIGAFWSTVYAGATGVAYFFAHNDGDGNFGSTADQDIIKCGSYTGNGSSTGPEIDLGFEPQWLLVKDATSANNWLLFDNMRGLVTGGNDALLRPNLADAELTSVDLVEATSTGFRIPTNDAGINNNGNNYIYIAIRRGPMAVPTDATDVYKTIAYSGTSAARHLDTGFVTDLEIIQSRSSAETWEPSWKTRLTSTGNLTLNSSSTSAEYNWGTNGNTDLNTYQHGTSRASSYWNSSGYNYVSHQFSRAPNCFDVVAFELGNSTNREVKHNLNATPEMIWWKKRSGSSNWAVFHKDLGQSKYLLLQSTASEATISNIWGTSSFSSSAFYLDETQFGVSGDDCIAYLFASLDGVSKVGSFTGNGSTLNVDCGFSSGARFVIIKRDSGPWRVFDTERGIVAGNDPMLMLNLTDAEVTNVDFVDPYSSGFTVNYNSDYGFNTNGSTFYFYAIA